VFVFRSSGTDLSRILAGGFLQELGEGFWLLRVTPVRRVGHVRVGSLL